MTDTYTFDTSRVPLRQAGVSLIEVLVSVFVLAFGILGIAAMQAGALRNNQGALEQSTAVFLAHSILDAMRASMLSDDEHPGKLVVRQGYATGNFICGNSSASDMLVRNDLDRWLRDIRDNLNGGANDGVACGKIACDATDPNLCTVSIRWNNSRTLGGKQEEIVETRSRL